MTPHHDQLIAAGWTIPDGRDPSTYARRMVSLHRHPSGTWLAYAGCTPSADWAGSPNDALEALRAITIDAARYTVGRDWREAARMLDIARACEPA